MKDDKQRLEVFYKDQLVGTLVKGKKEKVGFQYSENWLKSGFSISPFSLPLTDQIFLPVKDYFDGLFGVFADSLPDAWGKIITFSQPKSGRLYCAGSSYNCGKFRNGSVDVSSGTGN